MHRSALTSLVALVAGSLAVIGPMGPGVATAEPAPRVDPCGGSQTGWYTAYSSGDNIDTDVSACIYINGSGQMNIGGWATHTWSQTVSGTNVQFGCYWTNSSALTVTYGWLADEIDTGVVDGEYIPMSPTTATNWEVDTKQWAAGAGWWFPDTTNLDPGVIAAMQPPAQDTGGCNAASNGMPEVTLTSSPPGPAGTYSVRALSTAHRAARTQDFYTVTIKGPAREPLEAMCRSGSDLVDAQSAYLPRSRSDKTVAPDARISGNQATLAGTSGAGGEHHLTVACSRTERVQNLGSMVVGTAMSDRVQARDTAVTVLTGRGDDRLRVTTRSQGLGGEGKDVVTAAGRDAVASGGIGNDVLRTDTQHRVLLIGGPGSDRFVAGSGKARVNAQDGGRDVIECGSSRVQVLADAQDVIQGPCTLVKQ